MKIATPQTFLIVKEELDYIDIDDIGNLEDLLRIVFLHEEFGNLKVFVDDGELTRNIKSVNQYFFNKHVKYCESVSMIISC